MPGLRILWLAVLVGCVFDDGGPEPFSDQDSTLPDGTMDASPDAGPCIEGNTRCTDGRTLESCEASEWHASECPVECEEDDGAFSCSEDETGSNGVTSDLLVGADADGTVPGGAVWVIDSDSGRVHECGGADLRPAGVGVMAGVGYSVVAQSGGPSLGVFALDSLTVESTATLRVVGGNAVVFLVRGDVVISGEVVVSGGGRACSVNAACGAGSSRRCGGPGAFVHAGSAFSGGVTNINNANLPTSSGAGTGAGLRGASVSGASPERGGGGGGFGASGGDGGDDSNNGTSYGTPALVPLLGGSGGGGGGGTGGADQGGEGGGGGGALQITAYGDISVPIGGGILAGGAGGGGGVGSNGNGGGGGGSGGAILLEAKQVTIAGNLSANGGAGGGGGGAVIAGQAGSDGSYGITSAGGGIGDSAGGTGGSRSQTAGQNGGNALLDGTGGGGGSVGRIMLRTESNGLGTTGAPISPDPQTGTDFGD